MRNLLIIAALCSGALAPSLAAAAPTEDDLKARKVRFLGGAEEPAARGGRCITNVPSDPNLPRMSWNTKL